MAFKKNMITSIPIDARSVPALMAVAMPLLTASLPACMALSIPLLATPPATLNKNKI